MINDDVDPREKESVDENTLHLKTKHAMTVDTLATLKAKLIRDPSKSLNISVEEHYKTK